MLCEPLDRQVSGNNWSRPLLPTVDEDFEQREIAPETSIHLGILRDIEDQMARFEARHTEALRELRQQYVLPSDSSVANFLREHRSILELLLLAAPQLKLHFGINAVLALRVSVAESGERTLYAVALWPGEILAASKALDKFDDAWWIANSRQASGNLYFTYELV